MKWSFTGGLESNSVGFNLPFFGSKREAAKKIQQNMHNLQRKFDVLHLFFKLSHKSGTVRFLPLLLPSGYNEKGDALVGIRNEYQSLRKYQNKNNGFLFS